MDYLLEISEALQKGRTKRVKELIPAALEAGLSPDRILENGLLHGLSIVGEKFKRDEVFVPEVLIAAHVINVGTACLKPYMQDSVPMKPLGTVVLGTVKGDLHDIGKNLVRMMMECRGLEVIDLGVDVPPERFVQAVRETDCDVLACSALLTTTMGAMREVIARLQAAQLRSGLKIMIGGAPVSQAFCDNIGADVYTPDAVSAAEAALQLCAEKRGMAAE